MGEGQVLLMCPRCDEAFAPRFYRFCPACGCDAEEGLHVDKRSTDGASDRVLPTAAGLLVLLSLLLLCYWFLVRGA